MKKTVCLLLSCFIIRQFCYGQVGGERITVVGFKSPYTLVGNKVYQDTIANPLKLVASFRQNKIYKLSSLNPKDVLYTISGNKFYKGNGTREDSLLFYVSGNEVLLRSKKGGFASGGKIVSGPGNSNMLIGYLDPLEYFALSIMTGDIKLDEQ